MKHLLHKCSYTGWTKQFDCEYDARQELLQHICNSCLAGSRTYVGEGGVLMTDEYGDEPPDVNDIGELLSTACGCEFDYEED